MNRELKRFGLIIFFPILLPLWLIYAGNSWKAFSYYWKSIVKKDLNSKY